MATSGGTSASVKLATGMHKKQSESCKWKENAGQIKKKEKVHSGERESSQNRNNPSEASSATPLPKPIVESPPGGYDADTEYSSLVGAPAGSTQNPFHEYFEQDSHGMDAWDYIEKHYGTPSLTEQGRIEQCHKEQTTEDWEKGVDPLDELLAGVLPADTLIREMELGICFETSSLRATNCHYSEAYGDPVPRKALFPGQTNHPAPPLESFIFMTYLPFPHRHCLPYQIRFSQTRVESFIFFIRLPSRSRSGSAQGQRASLRNLFLLSFRGHEMNPEVTLSLASLSAPQLYSLRGKRRLSNSQQVKAFFGVQGCRPYYPIPVFGTTGIGDFLRWPSTSLGK
ncbi:hypothetical protein VNO77_50427 [Canavalia gladiata]|uniref:Uncharacterized protein n=1 Tax=Canavalia gladiata TaxID=3824 RepID=A0AAN9JC81_CANGL